MNRRRFSINSLLVVTLIVAVILAVFLLPEINAAKFRKLIVEGKKEKLIKMIDLPAESDVTEFFLREYAAMSRGKYPIITDHSTVSDYCLGRRSIFVSSPSQIKSCRLSIRAFSVIAGRVQQMQK